MALDTDMAVELYNEATECGELDGATCEVRFDERAQLKVTEIEVFSEAASRKLGKPAGKYITIESELPFYEYTPCFHARCELISRELAKVCLARGATLFYGLGNRRITADAVGVLAAEKVFATRHIKRLAAELYSDDMSETAVICAGVMAQTGIESAELAQAVCRQIRPDQVIVCDALACSEPSHMGHSVQLCSTGISPGSGVDNSRSELSAKTLSVPVAAIGVPTVSRIKGDGLLVTPKPADKLVKAVGDMIAEAVNLYLHPTLTPEEITSLIM